MGRGGDPNATGLPLGSKSKRSNWIEFELKTSYEATQQWSGSGRGFFDSRPGVRLKSLTAHGLTGGERCGYAHGKATVKGLRALCDEMAFDLNEQLAQEAVIAAHLGEPQTIDSDWEWMAEHLSERVQSGDFDHYECDQQGNASVALLDEVVVVSERDGQIAIRVYPSSAAAWAEFDRLSDEVHADDSDEES